MRYAETGFNLEIDLTRGAEVPCPDPAEGALATGLVRRELQEEPRHVNNAGFVAC